MESADLPGAKNTALTLGQTTYYFRTRFTLPAVPNGVGLVLNTILDDGAVVYLNGVEVFRQNIDATVAVDFNTFANGSWTTPWSPAPSHFRPPPSGLERTCSRSRFIRSTPVVQTSSSAAS